MYNKLNLFYSTHDRSEISHKINMKVKKQYKEKLEDIENEHKTAKSLALICPKIDTLIHTDMDNTELENKLYSYEFSSRRSAGYLCAPQLSTLDSHPIPAPVQERLSNDLDEDDTGALTGLIPEIDLAFAVANKRFAYWNISSRSNLENTIELDHPIVSVGLVKPPKEFFKGLKCQYILMLGSDDKLFPCEITFKNQYNKGKITELRKLNIPIPCENIAYERIK